MSVTRNRKAPCTGRNITTATRSRRLLACEAPFPPEPAGRDAAAERLMIRRLVVGISGATGIAYGIKLLELADVDYPVGHVGGAIASGSFRTMGMIVAPCSVHTLGEIAYGTTTNLLTRAADVTLKERRRLVLMVRETPLTMTHLRSMHAVTESGGIIAPPVPAFYSRPTSIDELVTHSVARVLDLFDIDVGIPRWGAHGVALDDPSVTAKKRTPR